LLDELAEAVEIEVTGRAAAACSAGDHRTGREDEAGRHFAFGDDDFAVGAFDRDAWLDQDLRGKRGGEGGEEEKSATGFHRWWLGNGTNRGGAEVAEVNAEGLVRWRLISG
jgi:hypothetical protein